MKEYIIGFRVIENKWYNRIFPLIQWESLFFSNRNNLELQYKIMESIDEQVKKLGEENEN